MKSTNIVMLGIAFILFGVACTYTNEVYGIGEPLEMMGIISPFLGIITAIIGAFKE